MAPKASSSPNDSDTKPGGSKFRTTLRQFRTAFTLTRQADKMLVPLMLAVGVAVFVVLFAIGWALGDPIVYGVFGVIMGALSTLIVFGRRAQRAMYTRVHGEFGAGASILKTFLTERRGWEVTEAVRVNRSQDMVHRVLGRPGIVLVGEGNPNRLRSLFAEERKHLTRLFGPEVALHDRDIVVGDGEGQVPLARLQKTFTRMKRKLTARQVTDYSNRLRAVGQRSIPLPKGPIPRSGRIPRGQLR